jgi:hypothetical protein
MDEEVNPYAAPQAGTESGGAEPSLRLGEDIRKLIATTALLMIISGCLQLIPGVAGLITQGIGFESLGNAVLFGVVPAFAAIAGVSLRGVAEPGEDRATLLAGLRQLYVAYLVKGIALILILVLFVVAFAMIFLGIGGGLFS